MYLIGLGARTDADGWKCLLLLAYIRQNFKKSVPHNPRVRTEFRAFKVRFLSFIEEECSDNINSPTKNGVRRQVLRQQDLTLRERGRLRPEEVEMASKR